MVRWIRRYVLLEYFRTSGAVRSGYLVLVEVSEAKGGVGKKGVICRASQRAPDEPMTVAKRSQNRPPGRQAGASRVRCADGQVGPKDRGGAPARGQIELKRGATV